MIISFSHYTFVHSCARSTKCTQHFSSSLYFALRTASRLLCAYAIDKTLRTFSSLSSLRNIQSQLDNVAHSFTRSVYSCNCSTPPHKYSHGRWYLCGIPPGRKWLAKLRKGTSTLSRSPSAHHRHICYPTPSPPHTSTQLVISSHNGIRQQLYTTIDELCVVRKVTCRE